MSKSPSRRFPVTVTQLPVTRCEICHRTVAYRPGSLSDVRHETADTVTGVVWRDEPAAEGGKAPAVTERGHPHEGPAHLPADLADRA